MILRGVTRLLVGWDVGVGLYLVLAFRMIATSTVTHIPGDPEPTYWDFVYLAFSIGTATQVSDVEISSKRIRRTVTVHGIVAFFFNVTVIALTVGLVGLRAKRGPRSECTRPRWRSLHDEQLIFRILREDLN